MPFTYGGAGNKLHASVVASEHQQLGASTHTPQKQKSMIQSILSATTTGTTTIGQYCLCMLAYQGSAASGALQRLAAGTSSHQMDVHPALQLPDPEELLLLCLVVPQSLVASSAQHQLQHLLEALFGCSGWRLNLLWTAVGACCCYCVRLLCLTLPSGMARPLDASHQLPQQKGMICCYQDVMLNGHFLVTTVEQGRCCSAFVPAA